MKMIPLEAYLILSKGWQMPYLPALSQTGLLPKRLLRVKVVLVFPS